MAELTIVLPTYDRRHVLERTIGRYLELSKRWPLLVVDDGSRDGSAGWLASLGVRVLRTAHRGLPAARNAGLRHARTPWVLFGEDDVVMPDQTPERLLYWANRLPRCGAVAPVLHATASWDLPAGQPAPRACSIIDTDRLGAAIDAAIPRPTPLPLVHACALVDRAAALAAGGYDSAFNGSHFREESDFYARLWRSGRSVWLVPDAWSLHVRHRLGGGCRGRRGLGALLANRLSYVLNDARYAERHGRMWRRWGATVSPGLVKRRAVGRLLLNLWGQVVQRLAPAG